MQAAKIFSEDDFFENKYSFHSCLGKIEEAEVEESECSDTTQDTFDECNSNRHKVAKLGSEACDSKKQKQITIRNYWSAFNKSVSQNKIPIIAFVAMTKSILMNLFLKAQSNGCKKITISILVDVLRVLLKEIKRKQITRHVKASILMISILLMCF